MGRNKKITINKEEIAEDCCFLCKDGGMLRVCDYKDCLKAYHPQCVERDDSFLESLVPWNCRWHSCFICNNCPKFFCFCCPNAVCGCCLWDSEFAIVRMKGGFCNHCLTLVSLIEGVKEPEPDEEKINFNDQETYEYMFKWYWGIIKEKEGLTSEHVLSANKQSAIGRHFAPDSDGIYEGLNDIEVEEQLVSDYDDMNDAKEYEAVHKRKRNKGKIYLVKKKAKTQKRELNGWASECLLGFLASIGKDTSHKLSEYDVAAIIAGYCKEHMLFHPEQKKKIICDPSLQSLLGRKTVNKNSIHKLLKVHFFENFEPSEDEFGYSLEDKSGNVLRSCKRQWISSSGEKSHIEVVPELQRSSFVSVISQNIKLVYLKRSLVEEMSKEPETFYAKVVGSFVRVKSDPNDFLQKNSHMLVQVKGIKDTSENNALDSDTLLQVSTGIMSNEIHFYELSDTDFSEEECEDLRQRMKDGMLKKPTVVEFEEKARSLHHIIMKHWIQQELAKLQNLIDQANEKGWRRELFGYLNKKQLLQTPTEQSRLLNEIPEIIAEEEEAELTFKDMSKTDEEDVNVSPKLAITVMPKHPVTSLKVNGSSCCLIDGTDVEGERDVMEISCSSSGDDHIREDFSGNTGKDAEGIHCRRVIVASLCAASKASTTKPPPTSVATSSSIGGLCAAGKAPTAILPPMVRSPTSVATSSCFGVSGEHCYGQDMWEEQSAPTDSKVFVPKWSVKVGDSVENSDVAFQMARRVVTPMDIIRLGMLPDSSLYHQMAHVLMQAVGFTFEATNRAEITKKRIQEMEEIHARVVSGIECESAGRDQVLHALQERSSEVDRLRAELDLTKLLVTQAEARAAQAVEAYKASSEFQRELTGYSRDSYLAGVVESRRLVLNELPGADVGFFHRLSRGTDLDEFEKEMIYSPYKLKVKVWKAN